MDKKSQQKLIFVYNANSGKRNAILDSMHKVLSPSTYACNLCDITFGTFTENKVWKHFRESSPHEMLFLHKDEFDRDYASKFGHAFEFPIVLVEGEKGLEVLIPKNEMNSLKSAENLIQLIEARI